MMLSLPSVRGASVSALHGDAGSHPDLDVCPLVHPAETDLAPQFPHQHGMELDVFVQGINFKI